MREAHTGIQLPSLPRKQEAGSQERWQMGKRGTGVDGRRRSVSTSSLSSNCCRRALACWAQPWPCAETPAGYAAQPAPCRSCASSGWAGKGAQGSLRTTAAERKGLPVGSVQEHRAIKTSPTQLQPLCVPKATDPTEEYLWTRLGAGTGDPGKSPDSAGQAHALDNSWWLA